MKKIIILYLKFSFLIILINLGLSELYDGFFRLFNYSVTRWFSILLIHEVVTLILSAIVFLFVVKILDKNKEFIQKNISKLILVTVVLKFILDHVILFLYSYINNININDLYSSFFICALLACLFMYIYLNIIYSVFVLKNHVKLFWAIVLLLVALYAVNFSVYVFSFNKNYDEARIASDFYLYPNTNIWEQFPDNHTREGNSAKKVVKLSNSLANRQLLESDKKIQGYSKDYIEVTEKDLNLLYEINQFKHFSLSEQYIPDDIILCKDCLLIRLDRLRAWSRGLVVLADKQASQGEGDLARENLEQLFLFGDQLARDKDDEDIFRLVGISIMRLSIDKMNELNYSNEGLIKYVDEFEEAKDNLSKLINLEYSVNNEFFKNKNSASYFKLYDNYKGIIFPKPIIEYTFYSMDLPIIYYIYYSFIDNDFGEFKPSIGESLIGTLGGFLMKINVGKNYTFYNKALDIQRDLNSEALDYYINNNTLSIIKKYGHELDRVNKIREQINELDKY
ncbi:MAG: hypothetical protein K9M44_00360 [Candidatus Pacebacteria bacterium]|nr:hypothetical protein [Candidatus Paceibacterota bacterium]